MAIRKLVNYNHDVVALGLRAGEVAGVFIDTELKEYNAVDTITLYLNPKRQEQYYDYIVSLKPKRVIFNPGTENSILYTILKEHNIEFEIVCTLVLLSTNQY